MYTHAQNFEDIILARLFENQAEGFYVDVGAHDPDFLSVTKHFYEIGWCGINIEPLKEKCSLFELLRPRDININAAIGDRAGKTTISHVLEGSALSTTNRARRRELENSSCEMLHEEIAVVTLNSLLEIHATKREIDFLKIDVEGDEAAVLKSIDFDLYRPKVILIESVKPIDKFPGWSVYDADALDSSSPWLAYLLNHGYIDAYFDGLNKFIIREDCNHLIKRLRLPPGVFDFILPSIQRKMAEQLLEKDRAFAEQLLEKDRAFAEQLLEKDRVLLEKEVEIKRLSFAIQSYRAIFSIPLIKRGLRLRHRLAAMLRPRLGNLNQYPARRKIHLDNNPLPSPQLKSTPKISVVTPSYQQGAFIDQTIRSIVEQAYPNLEYFVQDGGSTDDTVNVLKSYEGRLTGWTSAKDGGQSQAINLGFAKTSGEIMAWLNSDDLLLPGTLATIADYFNRHPDVDVVYGNRLLIDENDMEIGRWILPGHDSNVLSWADYVPQETLFWRRRIWEKVGGRVDESFRFAMDWDLLVRFRDAGAKFGHIPQFLGTFRIHEHQKTSAAINEIGHQEMNRIRERILGRVPDRKEIRRAVLPFLIKHIAVDMVYRVKQRLGKTI